MWTFTQYGFFSINRTPDLDKLQFRSRRKQDLENLKRSFPDEFKGERIKAIPAADYRWRLEAPGPNAAIVMCAITENIEYRNFKNHLKGTDQADKLHILHQIWHLMNDYQADQEGLPRLRFDTDPPPPPESWDTVPEDDDAFLAGFYQEPDELSSEMEMRHLVAERQHDGNLITIRELAKCLKITQGKCIELCESEGMNINVGIRCGGGIARLSPGDWTVEEL